MTRQNPTVLGSATNLRSLAQAIRASAASGFSPQAWADSLTAAAQALEQADEAVSLLERRLRELSVANVPQPGRPSPLLVSADRVRGALEITQLRITGLPTAVTGLRTGDIWMDAAAANVLKAV